MKFTRKIILSIVLSLTAFLFFAPAISWAATYTCNSCSGCNTQIANAASGDTVQLTGDITGISGACIDFSSKSGVTFNGQGHTLAEQSSGTPVYGNYGIILDSSNGNTIENCTVTDFYEGLEVTSSSNNNFINVTASGSNQSGFFISQGSNNNLSNCTATGNNSRGIYMYFNTGGSITGSTANSNLIGINIEYSTSVILDNLTVNANTYGIDLSYSQSNTIRNSHIENSGQYGGLYMPPGDPNSEYSQYNTIYNNYFSNDLNVNNIAAGNQPNYFNTTLNCSSGPNIIGGSCIGGNYWGNPVNTGYSDTCVDANKNGICDSAYAPYANNIDYYPLTNTAGDVMVPAAPSGLSVY